MSELLGQTSRTFALAIPLLPLPTRQELTVAYLVFRIADTIEDAPYLDRAEKLAVLTRLSAILRLSSKRHASTIRLDLPRRPTDNPHYLGLLSELALVVGSLSMMRPAVREAVIRSGTACIDGMKRHIRSGTASGEIRLRSLWELRDYCYSVAGIVGEMLTEVFIAGARWLREIRDELYAHARWFGEGLQLVNILKDADDDRQNGRIFIPDQVTRNQLLAIAREDLRRAEAYVRALKVAKAPPGLISFTELPLLLAWRTLECVEESGPGSKVPRHEVQHILGRVSAGKLSYSCSAAAPVEIQPNPVA